MSRDAAIAGACVLLAFASLLAALRCLADRLLGSAAVYTVIGAALFGVGLRAALAAL